MKKERIDIEMEFSTQVLGMASGNREIHAEHIASRAPTTGAIKEETEALPEGQEWDTEEEIHKSSTVFPRDENGLFFWDYQIRGFFKEQIGMLIELGEDCVKGLSKWQYKRAVNHTLFVNPRKVYLLDPAGKVWRGPGGTLQRPLRAETLRGERIALANSESLPEGTRMQFEVVVLRGSNPKTKVAMLSLDTVRAALDLAAEKGFGQWRGGGYGRYTWSEHVNKVEAAAA